jgi:hypothetical protein
MVDNVEEGDPALEKLFPICLAPVQ